MTIPYVLHQTYKVDNNPRYNKNKKSWLKSKFLKRKFYNDIDIIKYIKTKLPKFYPFFNKLNRKIEKIDFFRYVVMFIEGGIYADMDTELLKDSSLFTLCKQKLILGIEHVGGK